MFETEPNWTSVTSTDDFAATTATGRRGLSKTYFDLNGSPYRSEIYEVAANGAAGICATTDSYRDASGRGIASERVDGPRSETEYDALGRTVRSKTLAGTTVVTMSENVYDTAGRLIEQHSYDLNAGEASGITSSSTNYTRRSQFFWHDVVGRMTTQADYGSGGPIWAYYAKPTRPATAPTESSAVALVTKTLYNVNTGKQEISIDAASREHKTVYDALGRTVTQFQNYQNGNSAAADEDVETRFSYDGAGNLLTLTAVNPTTGNQVTRYLYEDIYDLSRQTSAIYPDSNDANSSGADQVKTAYYLDGNIRTVTDQNGTVRTFSYDAQRRLSVNAATTLGTGVDGTVRKIGRSYDWNGALASIVDYDSNNAVLDEVRYEYDVNQNLARLYQSHSGAVDVNTTPHLSYQRDDVTKGFRLTEQTYPGGKMISYDYGVSGSTTDRLGTVTTVSEGNSVVVSYAYSGSGSVQQTTYNEPGLLLTYVSGGLDRYGRIVNHAWMAGNTPFVHIIHDYDDSGNRTSRYDTMHAAHSELYEYDQINQIKNLDRGVLNQNRDAVAVSNFTESWNFDKTGNWVEYDRNGTAEQRTHNAANELQGIATHDANGNMTLMPGLKGKYDAWNRLVEVRDLQDNLIAKYEYNGNNQRIKKTVGSTVTNSFFNGNWQELESQTSEPGASATGLTTYVWGLRYVDDLICREKGAERLYSLADPNWNVVALVDSSGDVVERIKYDAFGKITWLDEEFETKTESSYSWNRVFTGQILDDETGLIYYRMRYYHKQLGRFISKDPIQYDAGDPSLFRYVFNSPFIFTDPVGLTTTSSCPNNINCQDYPKNPDCGSDDDHKKFMKWYNDEMERGQDWLNDIPDCPCEVNKENIVMPEILGGGKSTVYTYHDDYKRTLPNKTWNIPGTPVGGYHKGAEYCMRSGSFKGHASQCCYDNSGKLITEGSGAGSADFVATGVFSYITPYGDSHRSSDVLPADWATNLDCGGFGDFSKLYLCARPPKNGNCPANAVDSKGKQIEPTNIFTNTQKNCIKPGCN